MADSNPTTAQKDMISDMVSKPRITIKPEDVAEAIGTLPDEVRKLRQELQRLQMENNALRDQLGAEKANVKRYVPVIQDGEVVLVPLDTFGGFAVAEDVPVSAWEYYFGQEGPQ